MSKRESKGSTRGGWLNGHLPLETETTRFILVSALDLFFTFLLLFFSGRGMMRKGVIESNPVADFFISRWGTSGLVFFKFGMVAFIAVLAQLIAIKRETTGRWLLNFGSLVVGCVVIYSAYLMFIYRV